MKGEKYWEEEDLGLWQIEEMRGGIKVFIVVSTDEDLEALTQLALIQNNRREGKRYPYE